MPPRPSQILTATAFASAMAILMLAAACGKSGTPAAGAAPKGSTKAGPAAAPVAVTLAPVQRIDMPRFVEVTGTLFALEDVAVSAKASGRIASIAADLGDTRRAGEALAQIDPRDAELALSEKEAQLAATLAKLGLASIPPSDIDFTKLPAVQRSQAEAANAQARHQRAKRLHDQQPPLIADQDFADVRTQWEVAARGVETEILVAKATLADARALVAAADSARQVLKDTRIEVPTFGKDGPSEFRIAARSVSVGELVAPGRVLFRVVATQQVKFRGSVPERFTSAVALSQPVGIEIAGADKPFPGKVTRISPAINPATRSFDIEALADNPTGALKPGAFARGTITIQTEPNITCVPADAVVEFAGVQRIFTVKEGKATAVVVKTGQRQGDLIELIDLKSAPEAVVRQPGNLRDGAAIIAKTE